MPESVVKHAGWMPASPSMSQGTELAPDCDELYASANSGIVKSAGEKWPGSASSTAESPGVVPTRIMETGIDYTMPSSGQGNLEPQGPGVKGAG